MKTRLKAFPHLLWTGAVTMIAFAVALLFNVAAEIVMSGILVGFIMTMLATMKGLGVFEKEVKP